MRHRHKREDYRFSPTKRSKPQVPARLNGRVVADTDVLREEMLAP